MKNNTLAILSPLCLGLLAANAHAALEPFTLGASESLQHQSNVNHTDSSKIRDVDDWISITEFNAALSQDLGRDKLVANAAVDYNHYKHSKSLTGTGYQAAGEFDWNTIGDLSGSLGADTRRRQFVYGETAEPSVTGGPSRFVDLHNMQTDNHAFARVALGAEARWSLYGGVDGTQRDYSANEFRANEEKQWSAYAGTRVSPSPDLSFGLTGSYVHGEYPHGNLDDTSARFSSRAVTASTHWKASGNSQFDATVGYTTETSVLLTGDRRFVNGSLNWNWTPPSHFGVSLGLRRSSDADTSGTGVNVGVVNANNLNGTSVNNEAHLRVTYAITAKTSLDATADYVQRKYSSVLLLSGFSQAGATKTSRLYLTAHYQPTRTTDLSCGGGRETRHSDAAVAEVLPAYTDNYLQCMAAIHFD